MFAVRSRSLPDLGEACLYFPTERSEDYFWLRRMLGERTSFALAFQSRAGPCRVPIMRRHIGQVGNIDEARNAALSQATEAAITLQPGHVAQDECLHPMRVDVGGFFWVDARIQE